MSDRRPVVWSEGMTLDPHHLQQNDRATLAHVDARVRALGRHGWGVSALRIDEDRLVNGAFVLAEARAVFPDGLAIDLPRDGETPASRPLAEAFTATQERLRVFLAVPAERSGGTNVRLSGAPARREARFVAEGIRVIDETTGEDERDLDVARANVRILFEGEPREAFVVLPVAEIVRTAAGGYALDEAFVPPALSLAAVPALARLARGVVERLITRSGELATRWQTASGQRELSPGDVTAQALLAAAAEGAAHLEHLRRTEAHPADLFGALCTTAARLWAARPAQSPAPGELPAYDHAEATAGFARLGQAIEALLGGAAPRANYVRIPFARTGEGRYQAPLDPRLQGAADLFLAVRDPAADPARLRDELPRMLRVASPDTLEAVLRSYTRALAVEPAGSVPPGLPIDTRAAYFTVARRGPFWDAIAQAGALALFAPSEFADAEFELLALTAPR